MFFYNLVIRLYGFVIFTASVNKTKAKQWVNGRKNWRANLKKKAAALGPGKRVWVHCASYGEFEQGRPLIEAIKKKYPGYQVILSFFSPSGYEVFKNWSGAELICYLPLDTKRNAADFVSIIQPHTVIFIKYEFWVNFLFQLKKRQIPTYLVSAVFKPHHPFFKTYGGLFRRSLMSFTRLFVQDENSARLLDSIGIHNHNVCGDTRFDRVLEIRNSFKEIPGIKEFKGTNKLIIAGSTWPKDDDLLLAAFDRLKHSDYKLMLVPHVIEDKLTKELVHKLNDHKLSHCLFSEGIDNNAKVLVLNTMGLLSRIYHYGDYAYIGGGFNSGIHNCLEAAVYGIPVAFYGHDYQNFNEAQDLVGMGAAAPVETESALYTAFRTFLENEEQKEIIAKKLAVYFSGNSNITHKILDAIVM